MKKKGQRQRVPQMKTTKKKKERKEEKKKKGETDRTRMAKAPGTCETEKRKEKGIEKSRAKTLKERKEGRKVRG